MLLAPGILSGGKMCMELLQAGINVYTTVNVQHLECLNDAVAQITGIRVSETVPDSMLEQADDVELVDLPPDDLLQRLKDGKVYMPEQAQHALKTFLSEGQFDRAAGDGVASDGRACRSTDGGVSPGPCGRRHLAGSGNHHGLCEPEIPWTDVGSRGQKDGPPGSMPGGSPSMCRHPSICACPISSGAEAWKPCGWRSEWAQRR